MITNTCESKHKVQYSGLIHINSYIFFIFMARRMQHFTSQRKYSICATRTKLWISIGTKHMINLYHN
jgi:hypothetical protein